MAKQKPAAAEAMTKRYFALCAAHLRTFEALNSGDIRQARRAVRKLSTECKRMAEFWQKQAARLSAKDDQIAARE